MKDEFSMDFPICPICCRSFPPQQLQRHADDHFTEQDYASDFYLAHQIASNPPSPFRIDAENSSEFSPGSRGNPPGGLDANLGSCGEKSIDERYASLLCSQNKETFYRVEGGLMTLLQRCLELESGKTVSVLSGHVDHFQSIESWDVGWGCGWRNIQMLSSYLLSQQRESREVLYGGSGFVPNIGSLQQWLELAWEKGFDAAGSKDFDKKIHGKRSWIGTTECAALFRSFGLRARIVDFSSKDFQLASSDSGLGSSKRKITQVYGPMDTFLSKGKLDDISISGSCRNGIQNHLNNSSEKVKGHEILAEWVWNYFSGENANRGNHRVVLSEKSPLYFQHDGHSRTIVGIQAKHQKNGKKQYSLIVLDPSQSTRGLEACLRGNRGWQKLVKRGDHTLQKPQYQVCFIEGGIADGEELEELKTLHSVRCEF